MARFTKSDQSSHSGDGENDSNQTVACPIAASIRHQQTVRNHRHHVHHEHREQPGEVGSPIAMALCGATRGYLRTTEYAVINSHISAVFQSGILHSKKNRLEKCLIGSGPIQRANANRSRFSEGHNGFDFRRR